MDLTAALLAAGGVAVGHAVLPDHWVPLAVLGRTRRYPLHRVARLSALAGVAHVAVSVVLGAVVIMVGLGFRSVLEHAQDAVVGGLLILTGLAFAVMELTGRGHSHPHPHPHSHPHGLSHSHAHTHPHVHPYEHGEPAHAGRAHGLLSVMVPFGAAASPDLTILPVFLAASAAGAAAAVGALLVFATVTIATMLALTLLATVGGYQVRGHWLDRWGNLFTAAVLLAIGALVLAGVL